jgi:hypothetical protein
MNRKMDSKFETFELEEKEDGNTFDDYPMNTKSEDQQVCI